MAGPLLICFDGSEGARHALQRAAEAFRGGPAIVVSAWEPIEAVRVVAPGLAGLVAGGVKAVNEQAEQQAEKLAEEGARLAREAGVDAEPLPLRAERGVPRGILEAAAERQASAIVIGSRGLGGVARMLGSVAYRVVNNARCPVFIVPPPAAGEG